MDLVAYSDSDSANSDVEEVGQHLQFLLWFLDHICAFQIGKSSESATSNALDAFKAKSTNILSRLPPPQNAAKRGPVKRKFIYDQKLETLEDEADVSETPAPTISNVATNALDDLTSNSKNNILNHLPPPRNASKRKAQKTPIAVKQTNIDNDEAEASAGDDDDDDDDEEAFFPTPDVYDRIEALEDNEDAYSTAPIAEQQAETSSVPKKRTKTVSDEVC